jgi:hypothetical protein
LVLRNAWQRNSRIGSMHPGGESAADRPVEAVMDAIGVQQAVEVAAGLGQLRVGGETGGAGQQGQL